jgi:hypothetical protein
MYPDRFWAAPGTGEASNEPITGTGSPRKQIRNDWIEIFGAKVLPQLR